MFILRVFSFLLALPLFILGLVTGLIGIILWKWLCLPKLLFIICSIPLILAVFLFGYVAYNSSETNARRFAQNLNKKTYYSYEENGQVYSRRSSSGISNNYKRPIKEPTGKFISGYYIEDNNKDEF